MNPSKVKFKRFIGIYLTGETKDQSSITSLDLYDDTNRLVLSKISNASGKKNQDNDQILINKINSLCTQQTIISIGTNAPLSMPEFILNNCDIQAQKWIKKIKKKHPKLKFKLYRHRCCEIWLKYICPEKYKIESPLDSNLAPLTTRFMYLANELNYHGEKNETSIKPLIDRLGKTIKATKRTINNITHIEKGPYFREKFLGKLQVHYSNLFIYESDLKTCIKNINGFYGLIIGLNNYLKFKGLTCKAPKDFPANEGWIDIPKIIK